ncbi:Na/Pi cotransporter family protein [Sulfurimonas aquatica]|uniref:Na/Pi cotransporter family protein n=1 Tax=Sulfurimonas aquatica TaxID=2672570 RepID=A0A975B2H9_9BACT|nr:Na/Pi symporter [Sulfurimonas aquatica]QSZ42918.1 Na/Pi cotransporter family protein [Sulfurimonas aquatica]
MLKKIFLPSILALLAYGFWISPNFKEIAAGISIFLFGMLALEQGFQAFTGGLLEKVLKKSTDKLYKSILFGAISTTFMQSSSLVSILTISFLSAGLIGLTQSIGIIFGANLGTTTGAWLIAGFGLKVDIAAYAMPMLVFGIVFIFQKNSSIKGLGYILAGLGFLFLGIHYMKDGFEAFKSTIDLSAYSVDGYKGLFIFVGIGIFATVVMQSSHATLVLIITALAVGQISYENALALAIGTNIGTTITAIIGSLSSNIDGKRLAGAHFIFNVTTGVIAIVFIHQIIFLVDMIANYFGIMSDDYTLKLAVFHTVFNVIGVVVMLPFIGRLVTFLETKITTTTTNDEIGFDRAIYLSEASLDFQDAAMESIKKETKHLYENAFEIIAHGINIKKRNIVSSMELDEVLKVHYSKKYIDIEDFYHHKIKEIYGDILDFATRAQTNMSPEYIQNLYKLKLANRDIVEAVKDTKHLQKNLVKFSTHPNKHLQEEYRKMKRNLAELLRNINIIATTDEEDVIVLLLAKAKVHAQKYDIISNGTLDNLIRNRLITNQMATSLMNDSTYVFNISKNMISMAETLFIDNSSDIKSLHESAIISDSEVTSILDKKD